jgi:hypothetical protein
MYWKNRHRLDASPRYAIARRFAFVYASVAAAALVVAGATVGIRPLLPFLIATPFILLFTVYDLRHETRKLLPELLAPTVVAVSAPAIVMADGWTGAAALVVWLLLALRSVPTVIYVRARLRQERAKPRSAAASNLSHAAALAAGGGLAWAAWAPWASVVALALLLIRAVVGLSPLHRPAAPKAIGFSEIAYGAIFVLLTAAGYAGLR